MRYLGIDWGLKHLGFAVSEGTLSTPLKSVDVNSLNQALDLVSQVVKSENVDIIVIGLPDSGESKAAVEKAVKGLTDLGYKVELADETLTSQQSRSHQEAAALILQNYLDSGSSPE